MSVPVVCLKIPFIQLAKDVATDDIHIVAASWSPPKWMKTKDSMVAGGSVKHRFMQDYAEYHCKYVDKRYTIVAKSALYMSREMYFSVLNK